MDENRIEWDLVTLPSRGIHYENNVDTIKVSYLTASDENILTSPNFLKTNKIIDEILKRKIVSKDIPVEDLVEEDRQMVMLFLRNTSFGGDYRVQLTEPNSGKTFEHIEDISELSFTKFDLVKDENGEYPFELPKGKNKITFKFLNRKDSLELDELTEKWNDPNRPAPIMTRKLEKMIRSVDGVRDKLKIRNFVENMRIEDSITFRNYVATNLPRLDLTRVAIGPSNEKVQFTIGFGPEFFRPFYGYGI